MSFHLEREGERERQRDRERERKKIQRGREKAVVKAIGYVGVVPSRERERERERERQRQISSCKNKEYKKAKSFIWMFLKKIHTKDK